MRSKLRVAIALGGSDTFRPIQLGRGGEYWVVDAGQSQDPANRSGNLYGAWARDISFKEPVPLCLCTCLRASGHTCSALPRTCPPRSCPPAPVPAPAPHADWAIVTGGRPNRRSGDACAAGSRFGLVRRFQTNNVGLWLFTRQPVDPANTQVS